MLFDNAFNAPGADLPSGLAKFLGDHVGGGIRVEKAMPDDLSNHLAGSAKVSFGAWFAGLESESALGFVGVEKLEIPLFAITVFLSGGGRSKSCAFALQEHGESARDFIIVADGERTRRSHQSRLFLIPIKHGFSPQENMTGSTGGNYTQKRRESLIKYGDIGQAE